MHDEPKEPRGQGDLPLALRLNDQLGSTAEILGLLLKPMLVLDVRNKFVNGQAQLLGFRCSQLA